MLLITVKAFEVFDEKTEKFIKVEKDTKLKMENSLHAIAEWEKKYKKPWILDQRASKYMQKQEAEEKTQEEMIYYLRCMVYKIDNELIESPDEVDDKLMYNLSDENYQKIQDYLKESNTATTHIPDVKPDKKHKPDNLRLTSERLFAWLAELQIPFEAEYWNVTRLFNVIQLVNYDNTPDDRKKRQKPHEIAQDYAAINKQRLERLGTKG